MLFRFLVGSGAFRMPPLLSSVASELCILITIDVIRLDYNVVWWRIYDYRHHSSLRQTLMILTEGQ